ncbi:MAG: glycosyltransferase, partial [Blautia sp.]|nr:glycosyltransferase [Blautia sp.]
MKKDERRVYKIGIREYCMTVYSCDREGKTEKMKTDELRVTAVITTYKREWSSILRSVESILAQTSPVEEILIIDDNPIP